MRLCAAKWFENISLFCEKRHRSVRFCQILHLRIIAQNGCYYRGRPRETERGRGRRDGVGIRYLCRIIRVVKTSSGVEWMPCLVLLVAVLLFVVVWM